jgi:hypothetical protein
MMKVQRAHLIEMSVFGARCVERLGDEVLVVAPTGEVVEVGHGGEVRRGGTPVADVLPERRRRVYL